MFGNLPMINAGRLNKPHGIWCSAGARV